MALYNIAGYKKTSKDQAFGFSINYFDQGLFQATLANGTSAGNFNSKEYALTVTHARKLSNALSLGVNLKYINSNLLGNYQGTSGTGVAMKPAQTVAADIALYWNTSSEKNWKYTYGLVLSNISGKVSYGGAEKNFIPTNLRAGVAAVKDIDDKNKLTLTLDFNKLMVPTPQSVDVNGNKVGTDPTTTSAIGGIFGSLFDAPDGFGEELKEITTSIGAEYLFNNTFAVRGGYFNEIEMKGNRKYFTMGVGFKLDQKYGFDFAYLVPTGTSSPLANTLRVTLLAAINNDNGKR
jgi:carbohydrate-selective porin OprB